MDNDSEEENLNSKILFGTTQGLNSVTNLGLYGGSQEPGKDITSLINRDVLLYRSRPYFPTA